MELKEIREYVRQITEKVFAAGKLVNDPHRPAYHFHAPAQWMDDPNGIIYHKGYYHMMYSLNPDTDAQRAGMVYRTESSKWDPSDPDWTGGRTVWGHARSRDLIHWEHLPIALYPETDKDEHFIWFGCTVINGEGTPTAIYTSIGHQRNPTDSAEQWLWYADDDDMLQWHPYKGNPMLTEAVHGGTKMWEWRDPFVFQHEQKAYMILGAKLDKSEGGKAVVLLYKATNQSYSQWTYCGVLFEHPDSELRGCECPNITRLGDKWLLLLSPFGPVEYFVGNIDFKTGKFTWNTRGNIDRSSHFYATNLLCDDKGRCLVWGAIEGFKNTVGWNGINSLPRHLWLDKHGVLRQDIPEEISALRKGQAKLLTDGKKALFDTGLLELTATISTREEVVIILESASACVSICCKNGTVSMGGTTVLLPKGENTCSLHLFVDKSVTELIVAQRECISLVIPPIVDVCNVSIVSEHGGSCAQVWELDATDLYTYYEGERS